MYFFHQFRNFLDYGDSDNNSHPAFTYLKLIIETLEQGVKYVQS